MMINNIKSAHLCKGISMQKYFSILNRNQTADAKSHKFTNCFRLWFIWFMQKLKCDQLKIPCNMNRFNSNGREKSLPFPLPRRCCAFHWAIWRLALYSLSDYTIFHSFHIHLCVDLRLANLSASFGFNHVWNAFHLI